jgi:hypothetical protein
MLIYFPLAPMSFYPVFRAFAPLIARHIRDRIKFFGADTYQWKPYILSMIPPDQIEPQFGGTRRLAEDSDDEASSS